MKSLVFLPLTFLLIVVSLHCNSAAVVKREAYSEAQPFELDDEEGINELNDENDEEDTNDADDELGEEDINDADDELGEEDISDEDEEGEEQSQAIAVENDDGSRQSRGLFKKKKKFKVKFNSNDDDDDDKQKCKTNDDCRFYKYCSAGGICLNRIGRRKRQIDDVLF